MYRRTCFKRSRRLVGDYTERLVCSFSRVLLRTYLLVRCQIQRELVGAVSDGEVCSLLEQRYGDIP